MEIWISISQKAFNQNNYKNIFDYNIDGIRINMSRESFEWAESIINLLSNQGYELNKIYLDIGNNKPRINLNGNKVLDVLKGDYIRVAKKALNKKVFSINHEGFFNTISLNDSIIFGDGDFEFVFCSKENDEFILEAKSDCTIKNHMSLYIKGKKTFYFGLLPNEIAQVNKILTKYKIGLIISFVENSENIRYCKSIFPLASEIVPKIETEKAIDNLIEIIEFSNTIIIGRGDLGLTMGVEKIGVIQEMILNKTKKYGKNTIIATEVLDSVNYRKVPYRSEIIDITNSFYKGAKGILLTSETASTTEPFISINYLQNTINYLLKINNHE